MPKIAGWKKVLETKRFYGRGHGDFMTDAWKGEKNYVAVVYPFFEDTARIWQASIFDKLSGGRCLRIIAKCRSRKDAVSRAVRYMRKK